MTVTLREIEQALAARAPLPGRWLLLAAHPDDEVLAASRVLTTAKALTLAHATDGATPGDPAGEALAAAREVELAAALAALGATPRRVRFDLPDGRLVERLCALVDALTEALDGIDVAMTHAFEGGHPDHDACALALDAACRQRAAPPLRLEFPIYAREGHGARLLAFRADAAGVLPIALTPAEQAAKARALAAFASQRHVVERFPRDHEALRPADPLNVHAPRDPATLLWARGDAAAERRWREAAVAQLDG